MKRQEAVNKFWKNGEARTVLTKMLTISIREDPLKQ